MQNMMNRRNFIKTAGILGCSIVVGASLFNNITATTPVNVQGLFSTQKLVNGVEIPLFGFEACKEAYSTEKQGSQVALEAFRAGYRQFEAHGAESSIGEGFVLSQVQRQEVFMTLRLSKNITTEEEAIVAFNQGLAQMKTNYLDLLLVEIPEAKGGATWLELATDVWRAAERLYKQNRVKAIGVVNLQTDKLLDFLDECEIKPMINKLEISPFEINKRLIDVSRHYKMLISTNNPYGNFEGSIYDPVLQKIAQKHNKTTYQIALRWSLQMGFITLATAKDEEQIKEYANIFNFKLDLKDMKAISRLQERKMKKA